MYLPQISKGKITRKIILNNFLSAILLEDIASLTIGVEFHYLLFFYEHQDIEVIEKLLFHDIPNEKNPDKRQILLDEMKKVETEFNGPLICFSSEGGTGPIPYFCVFSEKGRLNYGSDEKWKDSKYFIKHSLQIFEDMFPQSFENKITISKNEEINKIIISKINSRKEYTNSINDEVMILAIFKILGKEQIDLELSDWINSTKNDSKLDNKSYRRLTWWKFWQ